MSAFRNVWACAGLVAALGLAGTSLGQSSRPAPRFSEIVSDHFPVWDADRDGRVSAAEIDRACLDPAVQGTEAAAIAALKRIIRSEKYTLPPLTREYLSKPSSRASRRPATRDTDREDSTERPNAADANVGERRSEVSTPDFQSRYAQCLSRIEKTDRSLFLAPGDLALASCHQGPLGDCFFVAVVGGMLHTSTASVRSLIDPLPDSQGYNVRFGNGRSIQVGPLTDAEIAISSTTLDRSTPGGGQGIWLAVLEKAYGTLRMADGPSRYSTESPTDALAKGGSTSSSIQLLTGHRTERITLKRRTRDTSPEQADGDRRGTSSSSEPAGDLSLLERRVRSSISTARAAGRLVAAGTGDEKVPPGMSPKHAYAVLSLNADTDMVTIWNPHGNSFKPRGQPGTSSGYATKAGVFEIPLRDFVRVFNGVTIETDRPISSRSRP